MALTIDALDLLHQSSYDALAIVSSDCDFTPFPICQGTWYLCNWYRREENIQRHF